MKTRLNIPGWNGYRMWRRCTLVLLTALLFMSAVWLARARDDKNLIVHEWGTFTSLQAPDGELLAWRPLETTKLPGFVYDWSKPGNDRMPAGNQLGTKGAVTSFQRMETPVVYFYTDKKMDVDLTVKFPKGRITEWYPQSRDIGPSQRPFYLSMAPMSATRPILATEANPNSYIHWNGEILPGHEQSTITLPFDNSGNHYFAARETDASLVHVTDNNSAQYEKFLFYRGTGNFATSLVVANTNGNVVISNTGKDALKHLFVLNVRGGKAHYVYVPQLAAGERKSVSLTDPNEGVGKVAKNIGLEITTDLIKEGLYEKEAAAMVKTWKGSWFEEEGLRVLYILPRPWTDEILPMAIQPAPQQLVRVMVGRAEVIPSSTEQKLVEQLNQTSKGDNSARQRLDALLAATGRFREPVLQYALRRASINPQLWAKLQLEATSQK